MNDTPELSWSVLLLTYHGALNAILSILDRTRMIFFNIAVTTDLGHPYWIYIIPTHDQWLLLQFIVFLMMDAESVRNM
jgi:hypothetical protein